MQILKDLLLLGDTDGSATSTSGLGMLTSDSEHPVVSKTSVASDLLHALKIFSKFGLKTVGDDLGEGTILSILLSVKEVVWDLVLTGVQHDGFHSLDLLVIKLTGSLGDVDICLLADDVRESPTDTLDGSHGELDVSLTINVGVLDTKDVLELVSATESHFDSGQRNITFAMTAIKGIGRRFSNIICKKADIDTSKRAGQLDEEEIKRMETIMLNPRQYKVPDYFLNRQKDAKDGTFTQVISNGLETKLREDLERMKKIRCHRGLRHYWNLRVRGQHTKTTGRRGRTVGVSKKK